MGEAVELYGYSFPTQQGWKEKSKRALCIRVELEHDDKPWMEKTPVWGFPSNSMSNVDDVVSLYSSLRYLCDSLSMDRQMFCWSNCLRGEKTLCKLSQNPCIRLSLLEIKTLFLLRYCGYKVWLKQRLKKTKNNERIHMLSHFRSRRPSQAIIMNNPFTLQKNNIKDTKVIRKLQQSISLKLKAIEENEWY